MNQETPTFIQDKLIDACFETCTEIEQTNKTCDMYYEVYNNVGLFMY